MGPPGLRLAYIKIADEQLFSRCEIDRLPHQLLISISAKAQTGTESTGRQKLFELASDSLAPWSRAKKILSHVTDDAVQELLFDAGPRTIVGGAHLSPTLLKVIGQVIMRRLAAIQQINLLPILAPNSLLSHVASLLEPFVVYFMSTEGVEQTELVRSRLIAASGKACLSRTSSATSYDRIT